MLPLNAKKVLKNLTATELTAKTETKNRKITNFPIVNDPMCHQVPWTEGIKSRD